MGTADRNISVITLRDRHFKEKLLDACNAYLDQSPNHRLAIGIMKGDRVYVYGNGIGETDLFDIGSVSKTFTAHLVLLLESHGLIDLHKSVDHYIPLRPGAYPTVLELLTHTAGYSHLTPLEITVPKLLKKPYLYRNIYENCTPVNVVQCLERRRRHKPSDHYSYSDFPYAILAVVCENVTKIPFRTLLADFIQNTLQMKSTRVLAAPENRTIPAAHKHRILDFWNWHEENPYLASGGMVSTVSDMLKYIDIQLHSQEDYITGAHQKHPATSAKNVRICKGWHTYEKSNQLWHVGGVGTFRSSIIINKEKDMGVVVLGNAKGLRSANVHYLAKMVYSDLKTKRIKLPN